MDDKHWVSTCIERQGRTIIGKRTGCMTTGAGLDVEQQQQEQLQMNRCNDQEKGRKKESKGHR